MSERLETDVLVLGGGPGGNAAAFRAADLGKRVVIVEDQPSLGGVCLHVGCIPSKTLLHVAEVIQEAGSLGKAGIRFTAPDIDLEKLSSHRQQIIDTLSGGLKKLVKARKISVLHGLGRFIDASTVEVKGSEGTVQVTFAHAVIAVGSRPIDLPDLPEDHPGIWDSTDALALKSVPGKLLVIGGGIIGLEMAEVYHALGSEITVVEMMDQIIPGADADLVRPLATTIRKKYAGVYTNTRVVRTEPQGSQLEVTLEGKKAPASATVDAVLVAVGRRANGDRIDAANAGITVDERGTIPVDGFLRTSVPTIYAVGDVTGNPMLAHRASFQGKIAAEVIAGLPSSYDPMTVPYVAYTSPEVAWMGLTEREAAERGVAYRKGSIPWQVSGRALSSGRQAGVTKVLFEKETGRIIGAGICGYQAGELLAEAVLALEMGAAAEDIAKTIHAHPTLSETFMLAAEQVEGTITDMLPGN